MSIMLSLSLACAALACASAEPVEDGVATKAPEAPEIPEAPAAPEAPQVPQSVKLVEFDGVDHYIYSDGDVLKKATKAQVDFADAVLNRN